jgi:hypothetical protein
VRVRNAGTTGCRDPGWHGPLTNDGELSCKRRRIVNATQPGLDHNNHDARPEPREHIGSIRINLSGPAGTLTKDNRAEVLEALEELREMVETLFSEAITNKEIVEMLRDNDINVGLLPDLLRHLDDMSRLEAEVELHAPTVGDPDENAARW